MIIHIMGDKCMSRCFKINKKIFTACLIAAGITNAYAHEVKNHIELLFFQRAGAGTLVKQDNKGCYDLTLENNDAHILYFSNAPSKKVGHLTVSQFFMTLHHDQYKDHIMPNGILNAQLQNGKEINWIGELSNASYQHKKFHYTFCLLQQNDRDVIKEGSLRAINLFVDPIHRWPP
jgi:hypothetical protein